MAISPKPLNPRCTICGAAATKLFSSCEKLKILAKGRVLIRNGHGICQPCRSLKRRAMVQDQKDARDVQEKEEEEIEGEK